MTYILPFLLAMVVTLMWLPLFSRWAGKMRFLDHPGGRKVHAAPIPRIGGLAMVIGIAVAAALVVPLQPNDGYFLAGAAIIAVFGGLDDRFDLDYRVKLIGQLVGTLLVVLAGHVQITELTLDDHIVLPQWISIPLTVVFLIGITNAINLADGLDGLAGGTVFLSLCALAILSYNGGQLSSASLSLTFAGAALGFLRFNTYPASVFMGDAGSQLLGFAVGVLSLKATQGGTSAVSVTTPILLLALPILDTLSVMIQRISEGRSPFSADKNHIHHKLLQLGLHHHEAVIAIYAIQADLFLLAYWMRFESDLIILAVVAAFFVSFILFLNVSAKRGWKFRAAQISQRQSPASRRSFALLEPARMAKISYCVAATGVALYALLVVGETATLTADVRWLVLALFAVAAIWLCVLRGGPLSFVEKGGLFTIAAVLVYLDTVLVHFVPSIIYWAAILTAAIGIMLRLGLEQDRRFQLTPLDLIVLFVALVVPSLPYSIGLPHGGTLAIAKLVVLFYAVEVLVGRGELRMIWLRFGTVSILAGLLVRPLL